MVFVPLPLFASLLLVIVLIRFVMTHDMSNHAHQLFVGLVGLYAMQSLLSTLRWGYGLVEVAPLATLIAPVLPVVAYLAYIALTTRLKGLRLWPLGVILLNWLILPILPQVTDAIILVTYLGFGALLIRLAFLGPDQLALSPLNNASEIVIAMGLTGGTLVASGLTDIYLIVDFIQNEGRNVGLIVTFVQTVFLLLIGIAATFGRASPDQKTQKKLEIQPDVATHEDSEIITRLEALFEKEGLHKSEDLSLRRLSRRLQLPDRRVSNAINRCRGVSVSQFVNHHRIKEAYTLLATTEDTILTISLAAGFATKSNFNREFLRESGETPTKWRKKIKQNANH